MKTCLIYGHNGLDLDVALNLRSFYRYLGFKVFFGDKLKDADILVVVRAVDSTIDITSYTFLQVHVFDYGGWDFDSFVRSINQRITFIFCTSEEKSKRLTDLLNFSKSQVFIALPPVDTKIWAKKIKKIEYNLVHIGNNKPISDGDSIKVKFNEMLGHFNTHVWGLGWKKLDKSIYHGKIGVFDVSGIYAKSKFAIGLMYPFQRDVTLSGRFWHAPLNGCSVFSEKGLYTTKIPGVIETDYTVDDLEKKTIINVDRFALQLEAIEFWNKKNADTLSLITKILTPLKYDRFNVKKFSIFFYGLISNTLKEYYQKLRLFKIIIKK